MLPASHASRSVELHAPFRSFGDEFMTDSINILVKRDELVPKGIRQFFVAAEKEEWKFGTL